MVVLEAFLYLTLQSTDAYNNLCFKYFQMLKVLSRTVRTSSALLFPNALVLKHQCNLSLYDSLVKEHDPSLIINAVTLLRLQKEN